MGLVPKAFDPGKPRVEYVELGKLKKWPKNPKAHSLDFLGDAYKENGFAELPHIDEGTGRMVAGHGRVEKLVAMQEAGEQPPERIEVREGKWFVPVVRGMRYRRPDKHVLASNRGVELGGWNDELAGFLAAIGRENLLGTGFTDQDFAAYLTPGSDGGEASDRVDYSKKVKAPIYEPKGPKPAVAELLDRSKADQLARDIAAADLPDEVRSFLVAAAQRHVVFDYEKIAEFYAQSPSAVQDLFERSALVIIDFKKAIEGSFVIMTKEIADAYPPDADEEDEAA